MPCQMMRGAKNPKLPVRSRKRDVKPKITPIGESEVLAFRNTLLQFEADHATEKADILNTLLGRPIRSVKVFTAYHDALLLAEAYAPDENLYARCRQELQRLADLSLQWWNSTDERKRYALSGTGIANSLLVGSFSFELVQWLVKRFPESFGLEGQDETELPFQDLLYQGLHPSENGVTEERTLELKPWLARFNGDQRLLSRLVRIFQELPVSQELRDLLYENQKLYVEARLDKPELTRTLARFSAEPIYFHSSLLRKINFEEEISRPLPKPISLNEGQRQSLWTNARVTLFNLFRETDPVTFTDPDEIRWYPVGRGTGIALFFLRPNRRLPLDSYVGYVAYKNGLPQAYGGSWIFLGQAKIGINIFPAYRGGESSWLFAQLIRTYSQAFGVKTFAVEPYQIGKNNPEGIESGAFWFYYRHGFRPLQAELRTLAAEEFDKINADRRYKSASSTLRRLAESDLLLLPDGSDAQPFPIRYSRWMTEQFSSHFDGDRKKFVSKSIQFCKRLGLLPERILNVQERQSLELLAPFVMAVYGNTTAPPPSSMVHLSNWLLSRYQKSESEWQELSGKCVHLFERLDALLSGDR